jgi:hypothetical protein
MPLPENIRRRIAQMGTTYSYRVFAFNTGGDSLPSNVQTLTTPALPTTPPRNVRATAETTGTLSR